MTIRPNRMAMSYSMPAVVDQLLVSICDFAAK
jgi:hypothetical protein